MRILRGTIRAVSSGITCLLLLLLTASVSRGDLASPLEGAEGRFESPDLTWFTTTQEALRAEVQRVDQAFAEQGGPDVAYWQEHLRWPLLLKNLGPPETIDYAELALVRRWMYSNREGIESDFFAELRRRMDAYLDAAYTFTLPDLPAQFQTHVARARKQCRLLEAEPTAARAAAVGRTLGWLERTRQLTEEVATIRRQAEFPNAQVVVTAPLIAEVLGALAGELRQSMKIVDRTQTPPTGILRKQRDLYLQGVAETWGAISLELVPNDALGELNLIYEGQVEAICHADAGPVVLHIRTAGPVFASTPIYVAPSGLSHDATVVRPSVTTRLFDVTGENRLLCRLARRRAEEPAARSQMSAHSRSKTVSLFEEQMQDRVRQALDEIRTQAEQTRGSMDGFGDVLAPVQREGAAPRVLGAQSTPVGVQLNVLGGRRGQWGAPTPCPLQTPGEGVVVRLHVSFFNNAAETIMAGKRFTDRYFMNYAKILQAELPLPLMVHARSQRWAMIAASKRPLVVRIPAPDRFEFTLRMQGFEFGDQTVTTPAVARAAYQFVRDEWGEYRLERDGVLTLETDLETSQRDFLYQKLSAFLAPILDGAGVALPDGGALGKVRKLTMPALVVDQDWIAVEISGLKELLLKH